MSMQNMSTRLLLATAILFSAACANQTTAEGYEGYILHVPLVLGESYYVGGQTGPTSTGMVWRQFVTNVDMRPKNYTEEFHILSRDNLNVGFQAHVRIGLRPGTVRRVVEELGAGDAPTDSRQQGEDQDWEGASLPAWYVRNVQQPCRTAVRDVVHGYEAYEIQKETPEIGRQILERLREQWVESPVIFETISIGNLTYPEEINREIQRKLASEQDLGRMERERQIAQQEADIMVTTARGRAAAQRIVNETLTPLYVQHEMLEGFKALSRTSRATIVAAPTGNDRGSPIMLGLGQ